MKKIAQLMMMFAAMGAMMPDSFGGRNYREELTPEELAQIERVREQKALERKKQQGLKEFNIDGIKIWALNEKNAIRKAGKLRQKLSCTCC